MQQINSKQNNCLKFEDYQIYLSKIEKLEKRISDVINQLKKPLNSILPPDFDSKFEQSKSCTYLDNEWIQKYKQIIAYMIEGQTNLSLMGLTMKFIQQFGGEVSFWMDLICDFSQNQKYQQNYRMWQINQRYKQCLPLPIVQIDKIRKFRRLAKNDIIISKNLLSLLLEFRNLINNPQSSKRKPEDFIVKIKQQIQKHQQSDRKLINFLKIYHQVFENVDFFHPSVHLFYRIETTINKFKGSMKLDAESQNSKSKKFNKNLNNQSKNLKQKMITDFSEQTYKQTDNILLKKLQGPENIKAINHENKQNFDLIIHSLPLSNLQISSLREKFMQQISTQKPLLFKQPQPYYCNIFMHNEQFFYQNIQIKASESSKFSLINPLKENPFINYILTSTQFYEQFIGDNIEDSVRHSSDQEQNEDSLDSQEKRQFCDLEDILDGYEISDDERELHHKAIDYNGRKIDGKCWVYNQDHPGKLEIRSNNYASPKYEVSSVSSSMLLEFVMIQCPSGQSMPINLLQNSLEISEYQFKKLRQLVNNKSRKQIFSRFQEDQEIQTRITKQALVDFINKKTKKIRRQSEGRKVTIYIVQEINYHQNEQKIQENTEENTTFEVQHLNNSSFTNQTIQIKKEVSKQSIHYELNQQKELKPMRKPRKRMYKKIESTCRNNKIPAIQVNILKNEQQQISCSHKAMTLRSRSHSDKLNLNYKMLQKKAWQK